MSGCPQAFFHVSEDYNRLSKHNVNFKFTQSIRLSCMVVCFGIWAILLYVWGKAIFAQLQFYILTIWLYAISLVSCSAGREVVEVKMVSRIKETKLKEGSIQPE